MSHEKRKAKDMETIDRVLRALPEISASFSPTLHTHEDLVSYLKTLFTNGMRLMKYREQVEHTTLCNEYFPDSKREAIAGIDSLISIILDNAAKTYTTLKETEDK